MKSIVSLVFLLVIAMAGAVPSSAGPYRIDLRTDPAIVPVGRAKLLIRITDDAGKPVSGATVRAIAKMPGMAMGEREETAQAGAEAGTYTAPAIFAMGGAYEATITVEGPRGRATGVIALQTGQDTGAGSGGGLPWGRVLLWAALGAAIVLVIVRMRRTGQSTSLKGLFTRQVLVSLLVLAAAAAIAIWAVNTQRRPGSMTPIEAQVMDMNAPAPEGSLAVRLARAERRPFSATVSYSGQAAGFVEQDVVPRVTGSIVSMSVYVGDRVRKGQVLARLDTSQLDPMVSEKIAGVDTAEQGVGVAAMEYRQALDMVSQAAAEVGMAQGELAEALAMLDAAQQGRGSAESEVASAQAEVQAMQAEVAAAEADRSYQLQNLDRMKGLFDKGVISKDEWQRAQAESQKSEAMASRAYENVRRAQSGVAAARAMLRKTDAEIAAARRKVQQAQSNVRAKQAGVRTAKSAADAAKGKIGQSRAGVAEATAGLRGAAAQRGYAELRAEVDGFVTQRLISPGTVVNPGQAVLKVAQVRPIRLQANVPESDLARIRVGSTVRVSRRDTPGGDVAVRVTSLSPALDPNSRTGIVEALYANDDGKLLPGQYLTMQITIDQRESAIVIPAEAVQSQTGESGLQSFVWLAEPGAAGEFTVSRHEVEIEGRSGDVIALKSGIEPGALVVLAPPQGLAAGARVTEANAPVAAGAETTTVEITEAGYSPSSVSIPANKASRITFIRKASESCGTEVIFPDLGIEKPLPLNVPVAIDLPAQPAGRKLSFNCGMNMLKGTVVVR